MLSSLAVVVEIPGEWLGFIVLAAPFLVYYLGRRAAQSSTLTESSVLVGKSVKNIEEIWPELGKITKLTTDNSERIAHIEGAREAEQRARNPEKSC